MVGLKRWMFDNAPVVIAEYKKLEPYNRHSKHRKSPREELNEWYRNRPVKWDEERDGAFWGYRGRRGARM